MNNEIPEHNTSEQHPALTVHLIAERQVSMDLGVSLLDNEEEVHKPAHDAKSPEPKNSNLESLIEKIHELNKEVEKLNWLPRGFYFLFVFEFLYLIYLILHMVYVVDARTSNTICSNPDSLLCLSWKRFKGLIYAAIFVPTIGTLPLLMVGVHGVNKKSANLMGALKITFGVFAATSTCALVLELTAIVQVVLFICLAIVSRTLEHLFRELRLLTVGEKMRSNKDRK